MGDVVDRAVDERGLRELVVQSDDLHADAMRQGKQDLRDYTEAAQEIRAYHQKRLTAAGVVIAGAAAATVLGTAGMARADDNDVHVLQTAAALENLAVGTYKTALTLPFIGGSSANAVVKAFSMKTMQQHTEHAKAFNSAVTALGGKAQNLPDAKYAAVVKAAVPKIKNAADVVKLAVTLEDVAAQTYVKNVSLVSTADLRQLFASVAGVEAQHKAILLAVQALLAGGAAALIKLPPDGAKLPGAAGSVGFPDAFYPTTMASPPAEGMVK
ncbi:ferritin-like domain-containing protein [Micromonosporaceae bacterium Da 78-11]